jgi:hypothetical protein
VPRLVIVLPLSPLAVGERFPVDQWPLHVTVVPPFLTDAPPPAIADAVAAALHGQLAITARVGGEEMFGRRHTIPVNLLEGGDGLVLMHTRLVAVARRFAAAPQEPAFTGSGFRPHVTAKVGRRVRQGDRLQLSQVALVDMNPRSDERGRAVLAVVELQTAGDAG